MLRSLQACRAAASLLVVLLHTSGSIFALPKYFGGSPFGAFFQFGTAGVDFFFVLSGFIIAQVHAGDIGRPGRLRAYLWKRFTRVYPVYWAVLLPLIPVFLIAPHLGTGHESDPLIIFASVLLLPLPQGGPILTVSWSMAYEVLFYALFAGLIASRRWGGALFAAWIVLVGAGACGQLASFPWTFLGNPYNLEFLAGILVALALQRFTLPMPGRLAVLGAAFFLATGMVDVYVRPLSMLAHVLGYTSGSMLLLAGVVQAERAGRLHVPALLVFLGDASYSIYLVHFPTLSLLAKVVKASGLDRHVPALVLFVLMAAASVLTGCLFHRAVERPLLRFFRRPARLALAPPLEHRAAA